MNGNIRGAFAQWWTELGPVYAIGLPLAFVGLVGGLLAFMSWMDAEAASSLYTHDRYAKRADRLFVAWRVLIPVGILAAIVDVGYLIWMNW